MKTLRNFSTLFVLTLAFQAHAKMAKQDQHTSIYTKKIQRIVNALDMGSFQTPNAYLDRLKVSCQRNQCSSLETQTIHSVGQQILNCQIKHLKAHGIENKDASTICQSKQAIFGCDSLASRLLRKMCYTGNNYSLKIWRSKESKLNSRLPASYQ